jgi:hypothetical protein
LYLAREIATSKKIATYSYDDVWSCVIDRKGRDEKSIAGAFVDWDNTPRKKEKGFLINRASPNKFEHYLKKQINNVNNNYLNDMIFLFAWNEWAEGGYLEPDEKYQYQYLEALKRALDDDNLIKEI